MRRLIQHPASSIKINALSKLMISEIIHALGEISGDEAIKVLVIRAAGKHFCAGHFLAEMVDGDLSEYKSIFDQCNRMMQMIHDIPQPVCSIYRKAGFLRPGRPARQRRHGFCQTNHDHEPGGGRCTGRNTGFS